MKLKRTFYSITFLDDGLFVVYNSITDNFIFFESNHEDLVNKVLENPNQTNFSAQESEIKSTLVKAGILIDDELDELLLLEQKMASFANSEKLILTIALTTNCNLRCVYCFEEHEGRADKNFEKKVLAFIEEKTKDKKELIIDWYGGEPLLKLKNLLYLNDTIGEICKKNTCQYSASISTNGYLLTEEVAHQLAESGYIQSLRVCIDGPPEIHDKYRPCANGGPSFEVIIKNMVYASKFFKIKLRMNLDKNNIQTIDELLAIVDTKDFNKENLSFTLKPIISARIRPNDNSFTLEEFAEIEPGLKTRLLQQGVNLDISQVNQKCSYCVVYHKSQYMMDWRGYLYKCTDTFDMKDAVGHITPEGKIILHQEKIDKWLVFPGKEYDICKTCRALPLCLGGCTFKRFVSNELPCSTVLFNMVEYVKLYYQNKKEKNLLAKKPFPIQVIPSACHG